VAITVTKGTANTTASGTFNVTIPAHAAGDVLVLMVTKVSGASASPEVSTGGWTEVADDPDASASTHVLVAWKVGDGAETTVTVSSMSAGVLIGKVYACAGADGTTPVVGFAVVGATSANRLLELTETCAAGQAAFGMVALASTSAGMAIDSSYTLDHSTTSYGMASKVLTTTDETGTFSWTTSRSARSAFVVIAEEVVTTGTAAITHGAHTVAGSGSSTTGTAAVANARQTSAAVLVHGIAGTAAITPATHVVSAAGIVTSDTTGTAAVTNAAHVVESSGLHGIAGTAAVVPAAHVVDGAGVHTVVGTAAIAHGAHAVAAVGGSTITGAATIIHGVHVVGGAGTIPTAGTATVTNQRHTVVGGGTALYPVATFVVTSTKPWFHADIIVKRRRGYVIPNGAIPVEGAGAVVNGAHVVAGAGNQTVTGTASIDQTRHVVATVAYAAVDGTTAVTHLAHTVTAVGEQAFAGEAAVMNGAHVPAAVGVVGVTGTAAPQAAVHAVAGVGGSSVAGAATVTNGVHTVVAVGKRGHTGTAAVTNKRQTVSASGNYGGSTAYNAYALVGNPKAYSVGAHVSASQLDGMRTRTGLPWKLLAIAPGGAVMVSTYEWDDVLVRLNHETGSTGTRVHAGFHWWSTGFSLKNDDDPAPSLADMQAIAAGSEDVKLDRIGTKLAAFTDDQLKRLVFRYPHEVGAMYAKWQGHESLTQAQNLVRATAFAGAMRRTKDRVDLALGSRASLLKWEFNIAGFALVSADRKEQIETAWPGNSYVDLVSFDFYADKGNSVADVEDVIDYVDAFAVARGNKPIGMWETAPFQRWGELEDIQASIQIPFYQTVSAHVDLWRAANRWSAMMMFEKDKNPPADPDAASAGEAIATRLFVPRAQSLGTSRLSWTAQIGSRPAWACNYPDVAEEFVTLFL